MSCPRRVGPTTILNYTCKTRSGCRPISRPNASPGEEPSLSIFSGSEQEFSGSELEKDMSDIKESLLARIANREARIGVIGLGYVGLPLVVEFAHGGFKSTGFEVDLRKAEAINPVQDVGCCNRIVGYKVRDLLLAK